PLSLPSSTLSLHDALPICAIGSSEPPFHHSSHAVRPTLCPVRPRFLCGELLERGTPRRPSFGGRVRRVGFFDRAHRGGRFVEARSEENTSELQSLAYLVCR